MRNGSNSASPDKEVSRLLDEGRVDDAAKLVVAEESFFSANYGNRDVRKYTDRLAEALDKAYSPRLKDVVAQVEAMPWPVPADRWPDMRREIEQLHKELLAFVKTPPFQYLIYRPASYGQAVAALEAREAAMRDSASAVFVEYPLNAETSFFEAYPVPVDGGKVMRDNEPRWREALNGLPPDELNRFFATYGPYLPLEAKETMAERYFASLCPNPATADLKTILSAYEKCKEAQLVPARIPGLKIAFLQVTSPDLIKNKTLDFPLNIKVDVPLEASKASMKKMFSHKAVQEADIVVLVNIALARAERVVESNEHVQSMYVQSYELVENPEYSIVKTELEAASEQYHGMVSSNSYTWGASVVEKFILRDDKVERVNAAKVRMEDLKEKMRTTPRYNKAAVRQPYTVTRAFLDIFKYATVNYYVIDKRTHQYFRDTFDYKEKAFFTVCYDLQESDENREKMLQTSMLEEDVVRYELEPVEVNLSDLLRQYADTPSAWKQYASMEPIHRSVAADVTNAQEHFTESDFTYDKYADKRFESVVVVRNMGQGIGAGFYVTDDLVLTNYHVVKENDYVRLKLFDEREVMGRVVARDAMLDLALIEAEAKGRPVCFYNKRTLPLGIQLEVIGHPRGLQFSITRGALSAIRKERAVNYAETSGEVLYIQTDAAINGGNSGGPMFYGNYVVGVSDWGYLRLNDGRAAQGLNFAIHYSEVFKFLDRHGVMVCKGSK